MASPVLETSTLWRYAGTTDSLNGVTNALAFLLKDRTLPTVAAMFTTTALTSQTALQELYTDRNTPNFAF